MEIDMFFINKKSKNSKRAVLQLVESVRTEKGSRRKLIVSLGTYFKIPNVLKKRVARSVQDRLLGQMPLFNDLEIDGYVDKIVKKIQTEGKWESCREQVKRLKENTAERETAEIFVDDVQHGYDRELGNVLIGHHFWQKLDFPEILSDCGFTKNQIATAEISILNRLIVQDSEHAIPSWIQTVAVEEILGVSASQFGDDRFYRISDKLLKKQEPIETSLYNREKEIFNLKNSIFFYDLTNTYFEGICAKNPQAEYGGNQKEKRDDCPQIVVGLVIDQEGFIRRHKIFNGKMKDAKSLQHILKEIESDLSGTPMPTLIFDRGVVSDDNMKLLQGYKYIFASRPNEETAFIDDFKNEKFTILKGREKARKTKVEILRKEKADEVFLLCKSEGRKFKESAMRNNREKKLEAELENLLKQIRNGKANNPVKIERRIGRMKERNSQVAKYYEINYSHKEFSYSISTDKKIPKQLLKSLKNLKEKSDDNKITYPALKKKLAEREDKYASDFSKIEIHLKESEFIWHTIDEIEEKERCMDGNYLGLTDMFSSQF